MRAEPLQEAARLRGGEVAPVALAPSVPHEDGDAGADASPVVPGRGGSPQRRRAPTLSRLPVRHPVDEEDDVPQFLGHQHLQHGEQGIGQEAGAANDREQPEADERVDALPVAEVNEPLLGPAGQRAQGRRVDGDPVALHEHPDQPLVAVLLVIP